MSSTFFFSVCLYVCMYVSVCDFQAWHPHRARQSWPNEIWVKVVLHCAAVNLLAHQFNAATRGIGTEKEEEEEEEEDDDDGWCDEGNSFWPFKTGLCEMTKLGESMLKLGQTLIFKQVHQIIGILLYKCWSLLLWLL